MDTNERLIPANARWRPTSESRAENCRRVAAHAPERFKKYSDYFFFIHVDPVLRFWHSLGMFAGIAFFALLVFNISNWPWNLVLYSLGVLFFYGFGVISHYFYDGGVAKTGRKHFWDSLFTVIYFNTLTAFGLYQRRLRRFVEEYPFTIEAYELLPKSEWERRRGISSRATES